MKTILIEKGTVLTLDNSGKIFSPGYVYIQDDLIKAVELGEPPLELRKRADEVINASFMAVMPGIVNAHTHLFQTFTRGLADDKPLLDWLRAATWPMGQTFNEEDIFTAASLGIIENIRSGATSIIDHCFLHTKPENDDAVCRAAEELGIRFIFARGWADMNYHPAFMEEPDRIISETTCLIKTWNGQANNRIGINFGPLIPWGCSDETMRKTYVIAQELGVGTHIHVAETKIEVDMNLEKRGNRHIEWLADLNILAPDVQLVHSVWLDDHELDLIAEKGAVVVHCPVSNMYLASGIARVADMISRGIRVALASDGPGSNNSQDMRLEMKVAALLQKVTKLDAMAILPEDVIRMACRGGAAAFGKPNFIGSLEVGKKADVIMVDLNTPGVMPVHRVPSALVYNATSCNVDTVIVDGNILMKKEKILCIDEQVLLEKARKVSADLIRRAGVIIS